MRSHTLRERAPGQGATSVPPHPLGHRAGRQRVTRCVAVRALSNSGPRHAIPASTPTWRDMDPVTSPHVLPRGHGGRRARSDQVTAVGRETGECPGFHADDRQPTWSTADGHRPYSVHRQVPAPPGTSVSPEFVARRRQPPLRGGPATSTCRSCRCLAASPSPARSTPTTAVSGAGESPGLESTPRGRRLPSCRRYLEAGPRAAAGETTAVPPTMAGHGHWRVTGGVPPTPPPPPPHQNPGITRAARKHRTAQHWRVPPLRRFLPAARNGKPCRRCLPYNRWLTHTEAYQPTCGYPATRCLPGRLYRCIPGSEVRPGSLRGHQPPALPRRPITVYGYRPVAGQEDPDATHGERTVTNRHPSPAGDVIWGILGLHARCFY